MIMWVLCNLIDWVDDNLEPDNLIAMLILSQFFGGVVLPFNVELGWIITGSIAAVSVFLFVVGTWLVILCQICQWIWRVAQTRCHL
jgi:ABC-type uncharacterized transport system permease subunit